MPRIDPIQLLNCLSVLLSPNGGIKSKDELPRLVKLMTDFSKKLVSKCIYIQVLKFTDTEFIGIFMGSGGWRLVHMWLTESIVTKNWPLVKELLELLLLCPVDIERLKSNNCPKLVKELSKDGNHLAIQALASKLVEQWLKTVKGEQVFPVKISEIPSILNEANAQYNLDMTTAVKKENKCNEKTMVKMEDNLSSEQLEDKSDCNKIVKEEDVNESETLPVLKITLKDGKQIISQVEDFDKQMDTTIIDKKPNVDEKLKSKISSQDNNELEALPVLKITLKDGKQIISQVEDVDKQKDKNKHKSKEKSDKSSSSSKSSSSKHSSKSHSSSSDKHRRSSSSSSSHKSSSNSKDKPKDKDKERHSSHSSSSKSSSKHSDSTKKSSSSSRSSKDEKSKKHSSESSKENKTKHKDKDSTSNSDVRVEKVDDKPSIHKLGKIPKLSDVKKDKPSISIEVRNPDEPKPKTVKTFHSRFRKHGLEEEIKPPPSRATLLNKKAPPPLPPTIAIPKRPSPVMNETPPEKKIKIIEPVEKPGSIKLIPAKAKPVMLLESDLFMDALNASATTKKEPKKRKRRTSGSKDGSNDASPPHTPSSPTDKSVPPRFYQDTLETDGDKSTDDSHSKDKSEQEIASPKNEKEVAMDTSEPTTLTVNGLKGVLSYHKRKGPKKSIKWKPDSELEEVQYFELDETERVNVTKTFTDMKHLERVHEREAFEKARNLSNDDVMEEKTPWRPLIPLETEGQIVVEYGKNSKEREIQAVRQKGTLQPLYFHKSMIPDSALEPEPETHPYSEPTVIPLDDITGNQDNVSDFRNVPWPDPKGNAPPTASTSMAVPAMFPGNMTQFPTSFPNAQFPGMPGFQGAMVPGDWPNGVPPMMPAGIPGMPPGPMGAMPPGIMVPENMMMNPEMFGAPNPMFPSGPPEGFPMMDNMMPPGMFPPPDFNMASGPPDGFQNNGFRGNMRGRGGTSNWRGKGPGNWDGPQRGRGGQARGGRKQMCIYFQRKGSCRQGDNCTFLHPGVNCPY